MKIDQLLAEVSEDENKAKLTVVCRIAIGQDREEYSQDTGSDECPEAVDRHCRVSY